MKKKGYGRFDLKKTKIEKLNSRLPKKELIVKTNVDTTFNYGNYLKKNDVDYDVVITISSCNRFNKLCRMIEQLYDQETKYAFKILLMDDGSSEYGYNEIKTIYPEIIYLKNNTSGGKKGYWRTINTIWSEVKKINTHAVIQLDDDFILCNDFINRVMDDFFKMKENDNSFMILGFHIYEFSLTESLSDFWYDGSNVVDGGMVIDEQFFKKINYKLDDIERRISEFSSAFVWVRIREYLNQFKMKTQRTDYSLVYHDGNEDSKLHPNIRKFKKIYTRNFIDSKLNLE